MRGKKGMHILLTFGLIMTLGLLGGRLFERFGIPQVVGYIVVGVLLGDSVLHFLSLKTIDDLSPITSMALAFIGFMVGGELKYSLFQKYGRQFFSILLSEGLLAMILVSTLIILLTKNIPLGILLGALSSATAPAATVDVLWEYRSKGPLTSTILAIVALDDGLALFLYGFAFSFANALVAGGGLSAKIMLFQPIIEIFGSFFLGIFIAFILDRVLARIKTRDDQLVINVAAILLASGIAEHYDLSLILTNMAIGLTLTNLHPDRNESSFKVIKEFVPPIYIIFFLFVGARLQLGLVPSMGMLGLLYVIGRTIGKWAGSFLGATISGAPASVRKYLGLALFSQAGVAVGLSLDIYQHFGQFGSAGQLLGHTVINVIAATTLLVQIIGPLSVKIAITKAGEIPEKNNNKVG
jgi:Kef-type K+ transport system membrane component KefB